MIVTQHNQETHTSTLIKAKLPQRMDNYEEKLEIALELNSKLKDLMQTMRNNTLSRRSEACKAEESASEGQHVLKLRKKEATLTSEVQHLTNNLNVLISQNAKLKSQVDGSRNSRVIYSNVYKNIEKEIRKNEYLYKQNIIDSLCYEEVQKRMQDRLNKATKKIEKDIGELQGGIKPLRKKDKRKSRLDTGLSSYRQDSKDTNRASSDPTARQDHAHNPSNQDLITKRDITHRTNQQAISNSLTNSLANSMNHKEEKPMRSKARLPSEKVDDYYDLQMKSNYYDNLLKHLKEITGLSDLKDIVANWESIDGKLQEEYCSYLELEKEAKKLREERQQLEQQFQFRSERQLAENTVEEEELAVIEAELQKEREGLAQLQEKLTEIIDINSSRLSDEEITQHIQRIKRRGDSSARELEKLLQTVSKQKGQTITASRVSNKSRM